MQVVFPPELLKFWGIFFVLLLSPLGIFKKTYNFRAYQFEYRDTQ